MPVTFYGKLRAAQLVAQSWLCIGLDPVAHPITGAPDAESLLEACLQVITVTAPFVCAYKPNLAYFLQNGAAGIDTLGRLIDAIPDAIPVILDAKFGDIGLTQTAYRRFAFDMLGADAITLNAYVGTDSLLPFLTTSTGEPDAAHGIFVLCRTSNVQGNDFQPIGSPPLYAQVASGMSELAARYPNQIGLVIGATQPEAELQQIRALAPDLPFLMPGIGRQGGDLQVAARCGETVHGLGPLINVGSAILGAELNPDYVGEAQRQARQYQQNIQHTMRFISQADHQTSRSVEHS